jgi:hypothetical protein
MVQQYDTFKLFPHAHVNDTLTLPENITDNGGLHIAFDGFQTYAEQHHVNAGEHALFILSLLPKTHTQPALFSVFCPSLVLCGNRKDGSIQFGT